MKWSLPDISLFKGTKNQASTYYQGKYLYLDYSTSGYGLGKWTIAPTDLRVDTLAFYKEDNSWSINVPHGKLPLRAAIFLRLLGCTVTRSNELTWKKVLIKITSVKL